MSEGKYRSIQDALVILAYMVNSLDLAWFLDRIEYAEAAGPILDPTLYIQAADKLKSVKALAKAAKAFQDEVRQQIAEGMGILDRIDAPDTHKRR